jgi:hypothetical protein
MSDTPFIATRLFGIAAEFETPEALLHASQNVAAAGYTKAEAYSPFVVEGVAETLGSHRNPVALITLLFGMLGGATGFGMCWYAHVRWYPFNVGGRPLNSWPAWIPITFELTVLFAALSAAIGMLILNGLTRLHHPMFNIPSFERASTDRFFLCIEATDPRFDRAAIRTLLAREHPISINEVLA